MGQFDACLLDLIVTAFEMPHDRGRIILGNMDMRTRLQRLKSLFTHMGETEAADTIAALSKEALYYVHPRNVICYTTYFGTLESDPDQFVFGPYKTHIGYQGPTMHTLNREFIKESAKFAERQSAFLYDVAEALRVPPPQSQASDDPPTGARQKAATPASIIVGVIADLSESSVIFGVRLAFSFLHNPFGS